MTVAQNLPTLTSGRELLHSYTPRGTALALMLCRDREVLVSGPAGTGKSRGCLEKVLAVAVANRQCRALVVRKTGTSLTSTTLVTWREHVAKEALDAGLCEYYGGSQSEPAQYRFGNGSSVVVGGMDKPTKIMSSEYDLIYVGEATELQLADWEALTTRLRNYRVTFQQLLADCNPDRPTHWLIKRASEKKITVLYSAHWENPRLYEPATAPPVDGTPGVVTRDGTSYTRTVQGREYLAGLENLTGVRRARLFEGRWVAADGLVYNNWDPAINLRAPAKDPHAKNRGTLLIGAAWPRFWVVDFGFVNPFVCQWWAEDPDGRLVMYREIYHTGRLVEDHARQMLRLSMRIVLTNRAKGVKERLVEDELMRHDPWEAQRRGLLQWKEPKPTRILCDHDAEGRATLEKHLHMGTTAARKEVIRGIQAVESRLKVPEDGRPRLVVMRDARVEVDEKLRERGHPTCTEEEFGSYVWPPDRTGKVVRAADEHPVKEFDHGMDAVRYIVADRDLRARIADRDIWV